MNNGPVLNLYCDQIVNITKLIKHPREVLALADSAPVTVTYGKSQYVLMTREFARQLVETVYPAVTKQQ